MSDKHTPTPSAFKLPLTLHCSPSPVINDGNKTLIGMGNWLNPEQAAEIMEAVNSLPLLRECEEALAVINEQLESPARNTNRGYRYAEATVISSDIRAKVKDVLSRLREAREGKVVDFMAYPYEPNSRVHPVHCLLCEDFCTVHEEEMSRHILQEHKEK